MRIKHILLIYSFLFSVNASAQDKVIWEKLEVDENLTVQFPKDLEKIDTVLYKDNTRLKFKVYKAKTSNSNFGITVTPEGTDIKIDNLEELDEAYKGIETGFRKNATSKGLSCDFMDTVIDKIKGRKVVMYNKGSEDFPSAIFYLFLVNDKLYEIACAPISGSVLEAGDRNKFITGLHFTTAEISEEKFGSKAESRVSKIGELIGELIGYLLMIGLVVGTIIYITKRK